MLVLFEVEISSPDRQYEVLFKVCEVSALPPVGTVVLLPEKIEDHFEVAAVFLDPGQSPDYSVTLKHLLCSSHEYYVWLLSTLKEEGWSTDYPEEASS